jgi:hypothetical protein
VFFFFTGNDEIVLILDGKKYLRILYQILVTIL